MKEEILKITEEIIDAQQEKLMRMATEVIPTLTYDDLLQPNDYPALENNPYFRYEEGVLEGIKTVQTALFALFKEKDQI